MSGEDARESDDEATVWDEIGEFTPADPNNPESGDDTLTDRTETVDEADVIDVGGQSENTEADDLFEELKAEYPDATDSRDADDQADTAARPADSTETAVADNRNSRTNAEQPADAADSPEAGDVFDELDAEQPADAAEEVDADEVFDQMDVSQVDGEALWDELAGQTAADSPASAGQVGETAATGSVGPRSPTQRADSDDTVINKRQYCQQCPYFSEPPEVSCSHEGTSIVEVLMDGQFRVRSCPVVTDSGPDRTILNDEH